MSFIKTPTVLIPRTSIDLHKWSVIACDQFTSQPSYWEQVKSLVDNVPSTYHIILPEAYLEKDMDYQIAQVNSTMQLYLRNNMFEEHKGFILVDRKTPFVKRRLGLVISIDLEEYEYKPHTQGKIRATEQTVPERIPPRVRIRENAPIELPHILVLVDDAIDPIILDLYKNRRQFQKLYDFDLNMNGGHVKGYKIEDTMPIIKRIEALSNDISLIVGDGNHSLAAAKVCWEQTKQTLTETELNDHPARYALVELISLYDEGLTFEPIHRVVFHGGEELVQGLTKHLSGDSTLTMIYGKNKININAPSNSFTCIKAVQEYLDDFLSSHPETKIDFIHGAKDLESIVSANENAVGITMPPLQRDKLLPYIREYGVLPRKSFSLGEAIEKRYYLEGKRIL